MQLEHYQPTIMASQMPGSTHWRFAAAAVMAVRGNLRTTLLDRSRFLGRQGGTRRGKRERRKEEGRRRQQGEGAAGERGAEKAHNSTGGRPSSKFTQSERLAGQAKRRGFPTAAAVGHVHQGGGLDVGEAGRLHLLVAGQVQGPGQHPPDDVAT
jgi:hypothetical protein